MNVTAKDQAQAEYLNKIKVYLRMLNAAMKAIDEGWKQDNDHGLDLNDFLARLYPFNDSFDDLVRAVNHWVEDYVERIKDFDVPRPFVVEANRIPDFDQLNFNDKDCYEAITEPYFCNARSSEEALDQYHESTPIKMLEDFEIIVTEAAEYYHDKESHSHE